MKMTSEENAKVFEFVRKNVDIINECICKGYVVINHKRHSMKYLYDIDMDNKIISGETNDFGTDVIFDFLNNTMTSKEYETVFKRFLIVKKEDVIGIKVKII